MLQVRESRQLYEEVNGCLQFKYSSLVLCNSDTDLFSAQSPKQYVEGSTVSQEDLQDVKPIPPMPLCPDDATTIPILQAQSNDTYIKRPYILRAAAMNNLQTSVLNEIDVCERLRLHPHPNIAEYRGCLVLNRRVDALCFKRYKETLMERVNPGALNKAMFMQAPERAAIRQESAKYLPGIRAGIRHLHSLGIIHNDLNPSNIMLDENDIPVIIDFDSCRAVGATLNNVGRTFSWHDKAVDVSQESNDTDALAEIEQFLTGSCADKLLFPS